MYVERSPRGSYVKFNRLVGKGSFKKVYEAQDLDNGSLLAWNEIDISKWDAKDRARVLKEVTFLRTLRHPNLIKFFGAWMNADKTHVIFITELMSSGTLKQFRSRLALSRRQIKIYCRDILSCVDYMHTPRPMEGKPAIMHRDLKCDNIFISGKTVKIGDLGLATEAVHNSGMTMLGTPEFMAPEMFDEDGRYTASVDIHAFAMCALEMITGAIPYAECDSFGAIYRKITANEPPAALERVDWAWPEAADFIRCAIGRRVPDVTDAQSTDTIPTGDRTTVVLDKTAAAAAVTTMVSEASDVSAEHTAEGGPAAEPSHAETRRWKWVRPTAAELLMHPFLFPENRLDAATVRVDADISTDEMDAAIAAASEATSAIVDPAERLRLGREAAQVLLRASTSRASTAEGGSGTLGSNNSNITSNNAAGAPRLRQPMIAVGPADSSLRDGRSSPAGISRSTGGRTPALTEVPDKDLSSWAVRPHDVPGRRASPLSLQQVLQPGPVMTRDRSPLTSNSPSQLQERRSGESGHHTRRRSSSQSSSGTSDSHDSDDSDERLIPAPRRMTTSDAVEPNHDDNEDDEDEDDVEEDGDDSSATDDSPPQHSQQRRNDSKLDDGIGPPALPFEGNEDDRMPRNSAASLTDDSMRRVSYRSFPLSIGGAQGYPPTASGNRMSVSLVQGSSSATRSSVGETPDATALNNDSFVDVDLTPTGSTVDATPGRQVLDSEARSAAVWNGKGRGMQPASWMSPALVPVAAQPSPTMEPDSGFSVGASASDGGAMNWRGRPRGESSVTMTAPFDIDGMLERQTSGTSLRGLAGDFDDSALLLRAITLPRTQGTNSAFLGRMQGVTPDALDASASVPSASVVWSSTGRPRAGTGSLPDLQAPLSPSGLSHSSAVSLDAAVAELRTLRSHVAKLDVMMRALMKAVVPNADDVLRGLDESE